MQAERLLGAQAPVFAKPFFQVSRTERPIGGIPAGGFTGRLIGGGGNLPALHHFLNKAGLQEPFPVCPSEVPGTYGDRPAVLKDFQDGQGLCELLGRCSHC